MSIGDNEKKRIAVLVSGGGTNLQALMDAEKAGKITSGKIALIISSNPEAYALERAEKAGIKHMVVRRTADKHLEFEDSLNSIIEKERIDLIVLAGFMSILSPEFTGRYHKRIINVHPSLIPSFCGKGFYGIHVHRAALEYGVKITGATVHFVNEIPDGGEIIMQKAVCVKEGDTAEVLQRRVMEEAEWIILPIAVEKVCREMKGKIYDEQD
ncbi:MAG: phosphoribosylglycinamide formyltransferase [Anaerovoracaceae bacterium]|jgi:phosphoribosylglycinamide formyltransferase-1